MPRFETEHSPMGPIDEYPIHQAPLPARYVVTSDPRAYERYWFTAQDATGELLIVQGFGIYPNLDTADGYAIVVHQGEHVAVRAHRPLGDDRMDMRIGPMSMELIEPFRQWRLTLGDNAEDVTYDLRWKDTKRAVWQKLGGGGLGMHGRQPTDTTGYESFGRIEGTVRYRGRNFELSGDVYKGSRDHHWGTRDPVGGPPIGRPRATRSHCGQWVEFGDWSVWGWRCLYNIGDERPGAAPLQPVDHKLRFDPETNHLIGGVIVNRLANGELKEVHYEQIGNQVAYLRCGAYAGPEAGTPEENLYHGMSAGPDEVVWAKTYDLTDPKVRMHLAGFDDHVCLATCDGETTVGILECMNPVLHEMCRDKVRGYSILEV